MIHAKRVVRAQDDRQARRRGDHAGAERLREQREGARTVFRRRRRKIGSFFIGNAKSFLTTAKQLMRRIRDKVPYSQGDRMMLNAGGGWMVEGSPPRLLRDYNR